MVRLVYKSVEGYQPERPLAVDLTSSAKGVYLRKEIVSVPNEEDEGTHWKYKECFLTIPEYEEYINEKESVTLTTIMQTLADVELKLDDIQIELEG